MTENHSISAAAPQGETPQPVVPPAANGERETARADVSQPDAFRPDNELKAMEVAQLAGHILLENGAEISRVEETMDRISAYFGVETKNFFVLSNGIFTTGGSRDFRQEYAKVEHIPVRGTQMDRVVAVCQFSRDVENGQYTTEQALRRLREIQQMPPKRRSLQILASGIGSGCFCYLFGGNLSDSAVALVAGLLLYVFVMYVSAPHMSKILGNICGGLLASAVCLLAFHWNMGDHLSRMIIGAVIPLIPGVPFTNGIRDLADGDYISGIVRLADAVLIFICIAVGVSLTLVAGQSWIGGTLIW